MFIQYRAKSLVELYNGTKFNEATTVLEIGEFVGLSYDYDFGAAVIAFNDFNDVFLFMPFDKYTEFVFDIYKKIKEFNIVALTGVGVIDDIDYDQIEDISEIKKMVDICYEDVLFHFE